MAKAMRYPSDGEIAVTTNLMIAITRKEKGF